MIYHVTVGDRSWVVDVSENGVSVDGAPMDVDMETVGDGPVRSLILDGASHRVSARRVADETWDLHLRGRVVRADVVDERTRVIREMSGALAGAAGPRPIVAPMPGMVVRVEVEEGDVVSAGQGVVIVEAMKMENELVAEAAGVVTRVHVAEGEAVEKDQLLVDLAAPEGEEEA
jgi:biotin carboxyl carrier protein